jgi:hypothetical protein
MRKALLATACLALFLTQADAANLYISEYNSIGGAGSIQIASEPPLVIQAPVSFTSGAAQSAAFNAATAYLMIECDTQCSYLVGANPTATISNMPLAAFFPLFIAVKPGQIISVIAHP